MASVYSVSQVNSYIKHMFSEDFALSSISIKGEVSNCKHHSSGHIYFTLKEENAVISCVVFAGNRRGLTFDLKEGLKVIAKGSVNVYERDGKYQLYATKIDLDGEGDLFKKYEQLKKELLEMGMFDNSFKKPIPRYAAKVGIVTAKTGAAIQDIINVSTRRNPHVKLFLYSAIVQGEGAKDSIIEGIKTLDTYDLDVIIIGRGGGSIEDLWAFNEEEVARAIFSCNTPIISAVGHETDTTIADYVSDLRAPTPSAAAELAVFDYDAYLIDLDNIRSNLDKHIINKLELNRNRLGILEARLKSKSPKNIIERRKEQLGHYKIRLNDLMNSSLQNNKNKLNIYISGLEGLSPLKRLQSGYSFVSHNQHAVTDVTQINLEDEIDIDVVNGHIKAKVTDVSKIESEIR